MDQDQAGESDQRRWQRQQPSPARRGQIQRQLAQRPTDMDPQSAGQGEQDPEQHAAYAERGGGAQVTLGKTHESRATGNRERQGSQQAAPQRIDLATPAVGTGNVGKAAPELHLLPIPGGGQWLLAAAFQRIQQRVDLNDVLGQLRLPEGSSRVPWLRQVAQATRKGDPPQPQAALL